MRIIFIPARKKDDGRVEFRTLVRGDLFNHDNRLYVRIDNAHFRNGAVRLFNGEIEKFPLDCRVMPIQGTLEWREYPSSC